MNLPSSGSETLDRLAAADPVETAARLLTAAFVDGKEVVLSVPGHAFYRVVAGLGGERSRGRRAFGRDPVADVIEAVVAESVLRWEVALLVGRSIVPGVPGRYALLHRGRAVLRSADPWVAVVAALRS